jgi:hypothetical protein
MKASLVATFAAVALGLSTGVAQATNTFLIQMDDTSPLDTIIGNTYENGNPIPIQSVTFPNDAINSRYTLWNGATLILTFDNQFNFFETNGITLSDTVEISGIAGNTFFTVNFESDTDAGALTPLPNGGSVIETGTFQQSVLAGVVSNGDFYNIQIASDVRDAPEPATLSLLGLGLVGLVMMRRRKAS